MESDVRTIPVRAISHAEYLQTLHRPTADETRRIGEIQLRREVEITRKYHTQEELDAATTIQKAYRGHRTRRELGGLTLDPSARWLEAIRELKYQTATAPQHGPGSTRTGVDGRPRAPSDIAKLNWLRAGQFAERAGAGEDRQSQQEDVVVIPDPTHHVPPRKVPKSLLLDPRYFLEIVDAKHRYGTNLLMYHEEWLRTKTDQNFFYWLDHGDGKHISLPGCDRDKLDREQVRYLSKDERKDYLVRVDDDGKLRWQKNNELVTTSAELFKDSIAGIVPKDDVEHPAFTDSTIKEKLAESREFVRKFVRTTSHVYGAAISSSEEDSGHEALDGFTEDNLKASKRKKVVTKLHVTPATVLNHLMRATVKPGTWIYVSDTVGRLYVGIKASGSFQHASFLAGARISSAGLIGIANGQLIYLSPLSGHYRPTTESFRLFVDSLKDQGTDLSHLRVSKALEVLLFLEYYGKTKKNLRGMFHLHRDRPESRSPSRERDAGRSKDRPPTSHALEIPEPVNTPPLDGCVEVPDNSEHSAEHKTTLARLMDDLHIRRLSHDLDRKEK